MRSEAVITFDVDPKLVALLKVMQVIAHGELLVEPWSASSFDGELRMSVTGEP
jgi:hypothetical protein